MTRYEYWFIEYDGGHTQVGWFNEARQRFELWWDWGLKEYEVFNVPRDEPRLFAEPYLSAVKLREVEQ